MGGCGIRPVVGIYTADTADQAVRAWSDAYNGDQYRQMVLLVHPFRRDRFEEERSRIKKQLRTWRIKRFELGAEVIIRRNMPGRKVALEYHDGRRSNLREIIVVKVKDRWWVWSY